MTNSKLPKTKQTERSREDRLKAALKENMAKRKAQARARSVDEAPKNETQAQDKD